MRTGWVAAVCMAVVGCAGPKAASKSEPAAVQAAAGSQGVGSDARTFVDTEHRFEIQLPDSSWKFRPGQELSTDSIEVPVVVASAAKGAQVVVQVAPAVATPTQFAERLTVGLRTRAGFQTGEVQPIPLADGAVGFDFDVADQVHGRVAILEGGEGRVYVLLATWPQSAPSGVERDIDQILSSMKTPPPAAK